MAKINFGKTTLRSVKQFKLNTKILENDIRGAARKEIQRVFHAANRRIENIEKSGVYSFAYQTLKGGFDDRQNLAKFAKFSMAGMTDAEIKIQYAQAVAFLQQPTSTASGAKAHEKYIKAQTGMNDWQFDAAKAALMQDGATAAQSNFVRKYFDKYKNLVDTFQNAVKDVADQMESDAQKIADSVENAQMEIEKIDKTLKNVLDSFRRFGM